MTKCITNAILGKVHYISWAYFTPRRQFRNDTKTISLIKCWKHVLFNQCFSIIITGSHIRSPFKDTTTCNPHTHTIIPSHPQSRKQLEPSTTNRFANSASPQTSRTIRKGRSTTFRCICGNFARLSQSESIRKTNGSRLQGSSTRSHRTGRLSQRRIEGSYQFELEWKNFWFSTQRYTLECSETFFGKTRSCKCL